MKVEGRLRAAKLLEGHEYYDTGMLLINTLLDKKKLTRTAYERLFSNPIEADEVLEKNIFAYHPENHTVTFQSRSVEYYFERVSKKSEGVLIQEIC